MKCWCDDVNEYTCVQCDEKEMIDRLSVMDKIKLESYRKHISGEINDSEELKKLIEYLNKRNIHDYVLDL